MPDRVPAHELGHIASGLPCGSLVIGGRPFTRVPGTRGEYREITAEERESMETKANAIARAWGFSSEEAAWRR
jgi:hypothetical protein